MKVTKNIRNFVEKQVEEIYAPITAHYEEESKNAENAYDELCKIVIPIWEKAVSTLSEEIKKSNNKYINSIDLTSWDFKDYSCPTPTRYKYRRDSKLFNELKENSEKIKDEKNEKVSEILALLELGAKKDELIEMLEKLKKEVDGMY